LAPVTNNPSPAPVSDHNKVVKSNNEGFSNNY